MSADNALGLIISHVIAKLMLLLPFSSTETCVLLDLRRTENAGFLPFFFLFISYYLGIWRRNEEMQRDLSREVTMNGLLNMVLWSNVLCKYLLC